MLRRAASSKPMASASVERPTPPWADRKAITRVPTAAAPGLVLANPCSGATVRVRAISVWTAL